MVNTNMEVKENFKNFYFNLKKETVIYLNTEFEKLYFSKNEIKLLNHILIYIYKMYFGLYRKNQLIDGYKSPAVNHFIEAFKNFIYLKDNFNINYLETIITIFLHDSIEDKIFVVPGKHPYIVFSDIKNNILNENYSIHGCNRKCPDEIIKHISILNIYKFLNFLSKKNKVNLNIKKIIKSIYLLTKDKDQSIDSYLRNIKKDDISFVVKLCDFIDNIRGPLTPKMEKKYVKYILFYKNYIDLKNFIRPCVLKEIESQIILKLL